MSFTIFFYFFSFLNFFNVLCFILRYQKIYKVNFLPKEKKHKLHLDSSNSVMCTTDCYINVLFIYYYFFIQLQLSAFLPIPPPEPSQSHLPTPYLYSPP